MLANQLFPNAKEITESLACFEATTHLGPGFEWNNPEVSVFVVGDGHKPRTAATFAYRTTWWATSIDPVLAPRLYDIKRLRTIRNKIENVPPVALNGPVLIVMPHSHAPIKETLSAFSGKRRALITMDCCVSQIVPGKAPDVEYIDEQVWSPKNIVRVWNDV